MHKAFLSVMVLAGVLCVPAQAAELEPLTPAQITTDNGDAAIRCATVAYVASQSDTLSNVEGGRELISRMMRRMLDIARSAYPDASDQDLQTRMKSALVGYQQLAADGNTARAGKAIKADFSTCMNGTRALYGADLLPDE